MLTAATTICIASPSSALAVPTLENYDPKNAETSPSSGQSYFPTILPPLTKRATFRYSMGRDAFALEQLLVFKDVAATVRTTVIKLSNGDLWVYNPQYPTGEYCRLLDEIGPVKHVVLGCNALEHKAPVGAFCKKYPNASVWISPGQYGPFGKCGRTMAEDYNMGYRIDGIIPPTSSGNDPLPPWADEFDFRTLYISLPENAGPVSEVALRHKQSKSLITTDAVVYIPESPPDIFGTYFSKTSMEEEGFWEKAVLQAVFLPSRREERKANDAGGNNNDISYYWPGYESIKGRLLRAPILRAFGDARAPDATRSWVESIQTMGYFDRILTCHFASPVKSTPDEFVSAYSYLFADEKKRRIEGDGPSIACEDWDVLDGLNKFIDDNNLGAKVVFDYKAGCP